MIARKAAGVKRREDGAGDTEEGAEEEGEKREKQRKTRKQRKGKEVFTAKARKAKRKKEESHGGKGGKKRAVKSRCVRGVLRGWFFTTKAKRARGSGRGLRAALFKKCRVALTK
jgi:hypothetical protein